MAAADMDTTPIMSFTLFDFKRFMQAKKRKKYNPGQETVCLCFTWVAKTKMFN